MEEWRHYFPFKNIRQQQIDAIEFALKEFETKKYVILDCGTGVGKSAIGFTIARYIQDRIATTKEIKDGSYFITTQKILQDQYMEDFERFDLVNIKSAQNYSCNYHKKKNCADGMQLLKSEQNKQSKFWKMCSGNGCNYKQAKQQFNSSRLGITNFAYFLHAMNFGTSMLSAKVLVIDEAHNVDQELSGFIEISISQRFSENVLNLEFPEDRDENKIFEWISKQYYPTLVAHVLSVGEKLEKFIQSSEKLKEFENLMKQFDMLEKHSGKIAQFVSIWDNQNWCMDVVESDVQKSLKLVFKPIDISKYTEQYLFRAAEKILFMSATIINRDAFCQQLGIKLEDVGFISIPSPFPVENRPMLISTVGKMNANTIESTLPKLLIAIKDILEHHKNEKGIIHTNSYKISNYIMKNLKNSRLLTHTSENRDEVLNKHLNSTAPTVLLSPSMTEGVDLKGDLSRFQIVCKIPYPYLGDKLVQKRMKKWSWWYPMQTVKTLVQAIGRSIRSQDDFAVSYILDEDWYRFYSQNSHFFDAEFKRTIQQV